MENEENRRSLIKSSDIESRLIILKRRAAEADFLREERDMLISRLKLYNPDYIWPDGGINKCLNLPISEEYEELKKRNEILTSENSALIDWKNQLISENQNLKVRIQSLAKELEEIKKGCSQLEVLAKENEQLKISLQEMESLKNEKYQLTVEKEQLQEDLNKLLNNDSIQLDKESRTLLQQLYLRINKCSEQYYNLLNDLWSKEVQIDVLTGKVSQLNAKLNEPYISAKIKLSLGMDLSHEEGYVWAVHNLEMTNKKMNCELQKVTEQLNLVTEKYLKMKEELYPMKTAKKGKVAPGDLQAALLKLKQEEYGWYSKDTDATGDMYEMSERGSTAPVTRDASEESMFRPLSLLAGVNQLEILRENTYYMEELNNKLIGIRNYMRRKGRESQTRTFSRLQALNTSYLRIVT